MSTCPTNDDSTGKVAYPPADNKVREYFMASEPIMAENVDEQATRYLVFLQILFDLTVDLIESKSNVHKAGDLRELLGSESSERAGLYARVADKAGKALEAEKGGNDQPSDRRKKALACTSQSLQRLRKSLSISDDKGPIVIYFDEAHILHTKLTPDDNVSFYAALCSALSSLESDIFAIFLSTKSSLTAFAPPQELHPSLRVFSAAENHLVAPFTELPFDIHPRLPIKDVTLEKLHTASFMCRFGRPL